ncbi:hypothetical protein G7Y89_g3904 [Cudoniella acicularis]|uniref:NAD-dependent epimerase/dehydratase domain-containing protein n=1 Tax=Cudoniella acicularis TaxID=354080 RepID=A0A8H4RSI9_9HELO|nr:hypothetical protein G7Y89_g3904 [Cudoniella acicularis]
MGELDEAEKQISSLIPMAVTHLGEDHLGVLARKNDLSRVFVKQKRFLEAEAILLEISKPEKHYKTATATSDHPDRCKVDDSLRTYDELEDIIKAIRRGKKASGISNTFWRTIRGDKWGLFELDAPTTEPRQAKLLRLRIYEVNMHFFITGVTGYVGSVCAEKALAEGHTVHGLSRTEAGDAKLKALGVIPIRGDLSTFDILEQESAKADVVFHCAFNHDFANTSYDDILRADCDAVNALAKGLKGSGKPLIVSSGSGAKAPDPNGGETDENSPVDENFPLKGRLAVEEYAMEKNKDGIRVSIIRLAPFVYGRGGSTFLPWLIAKAHAARESLYIGDGSTHVTAVHVDDAATLYLAVAKHAAQGGIFNGSGSTNVTAKEVAEAIGTLLGVPVRSVTREEAVREEKLGMILTLFLGMECRSSNKKAREELGWMPAGTSPEPTTSILSTTEEESKVLKESLFKDGRYAHLWKTYESKESVENVNKSDQEKIADVLEGYKYRKAEIRRATLENCANELLVSLNRSEEVDEKIQMYTDTLYHRILDQEAAVEATKAEGKPIPTFPPILTKSPKAIRAFETEVLSENNKTQPADLSEKIQRALKKRLEDLPEGERQLEERAIKAKIQARE